MDEASIDKMREEMEDNFLTAVARGDVEKVLRFMTVLDPSLRDDAALKLAYRFNQHAIIKILEAYLGEQAAARANIRGQGRAAEVMVAKVDEVMVAKVDEVMVAKVDEVMVAKVDEVMVAKVDEVMVAKVDEVMVAKVDEVMMGEKMDEKMRDRQRVMVRMQERPIEERVQDRPMMVRKERRQKVANVMVIDKRMQDRPTVDEIAVLNRATTTKRATTANVTVIEETEEEKVQNWPTVVGVDEMALTALRKARAKAQIEFEKNKKNYRGVVNLERGTPARIEHLNHKLADAVREKDQKKVLKLIQAGANPAFEFNYCIRRAAEDGEIDLVQVLLADPRVNPADDESGAIRMALIYEREKVVLLLARIPNVLILAIYHYVKYDNMRRLYRLAQMTGACPRSETDPSISDEDLLVWAAAVGSMSLVECLVRKGVDPTFSNESALAAAIQYGRKDVEKYLHQLKLVNGINFR